MSAHERAQAPAANLGRPIAFGRTAEVYAWGEGHILKLYRPGWARAAAEHEVRIARAVHATGLPVPAPGELVEAGGRTGLVYERVEGPSMLAEFVVRPWRIWQSARLLAELHAAMHARPAPGLPDQRERLERKIRRAAALPAGLRDAALAALARLPGGDRLCHGDFHPDNVLMTARGPVIIDWVDATCGSPLADVARTLLLARLGTPPSLGRGMRLLFLVARRTFRSTYMERYLQLRPGGRHELAAWQPLIAAARLQGGIVEEQARLLAIVEAGLTAWA